MRKSWRNFDNDQTATVRWYDTDKVRAQIWIFKKRTSSIIQNSVPLSNYYYNEVNLYSM